MLSTWSKLDNTVVTSTSTDTLTLALHVLTGAGFGQTYDFASGAQSVVPGHKISYKDALREVLDGFIYLLIFNHDLLGKPYMPKSVRKTGRAAQEFKQYMREMIGRERQLMEKRDSNSGNLISSLVRASEEGKAASYSLDENEIMGM